MRAVAFASEGVFTKNIARALGVLLATCAQHRNSRVTFALCVRANASSIFMPGAIDSGDLMSTPFRLTSTIRQGSGLPLPIDTQALMPRACQRGWSRRSVKAISRFPGFSSWSTLASSLSSDRLYQKYSGSRRYLSLKQTACHVENLLSNRHLQVSLHVLELHL